MKKFEGWRTEELQYVATLIAGREMIAPADGAPMYQLYPEIIREIRNRRIAKEIFQTKLNLEGPGNP